MRRLDEQALRRPTFREGTSFKMGDGQEWHLPYPRVVLVPTIKETGGVGSKVILEDNTYWDVLEQIDLALKTNNAEALCAGIAVVTIRLLVQNYELELVQAAALVPPLDPSYLSEEWKSLLDHVSGVDRHPKPSAGGSK